MGLVKPLAQWAISGLLAALLGQPILAQEDPDRTVLRDWVFLSQTDDDGTLKCIAGVGNAAGDFRVLLTQDGAVVLRFAVKAMDLTKGRYQIGLQIDALPPWSFANTEGEGAVLLLALPNDTNGREILREMLDGRSLSLQDNLGLSVIRYSLLGSGVALQKMLECGG